MSVPALVPETELVRGTLVLPTEIFWTGKELSMLSEMAVWLWMLERSGALKLPTDGSKSWRGTGSPTEKNPPKDGPVEVPLYGSDPVKKTVT